MKLYFEVFDYFSLSNHLLRTFVCDLCLIWRWGGGGGHISESVQMYFEIMGFV